MPTSETSSQTLARLARGVALGVFALFALLLLVRPAPTLHVFWQLVVPLLPVSFMLSPALWRAVCPLATLNMLGNESAWRRLPGHVSRSSGAGGIAALALLVPARHLLFNDHAWAVLALVGVMGVIALLTGYVYHAKAGFCNTMCPLLPVERLYGQRPVFQVANPRCTACDLCTPRGCLDLAAEKSVAQILGPSRHHSAWLATAFGVFAASFPGFIAGYFTVTGTPVVDSATATLLHVLALYGYVFGCAAASYAVVSGTVLVSGWRSQAVIPALAVASAAVYYWFAVPSALVTWTDGHGTTLVRATLLLAVMAWGLRARRGRARAAVQAS